MNWVPYLYKSSWKHIKTSSKKKTVKEDKICGALRDLVPFIQFTKREKHPWRSANFSNVAGLQLYFSNVAGLQLY